MTRTLIRRALGDARVRTVAFACVFGIAAYINPVTYRHTYPTLAERISFAHGYGDNTAVVLFYGRPHDLLTVGGYSAWRTGGILSILAAVFGLLAAVRALRAEEDAGRTELVLGGTISRVRVYVACTIAIAAGAMALWGAALAGSAMASLPAGGAAYLALAVISMVPVFAGVGAVASQVAPTRRVALELGGAILMASLALRVSADTAGGAEWLRWVTPLGWVELMRPFAGARPVVLVLPLALATLLLALAARLVAGRDLGGAVPLVRERGAPRLSLLSSPVAQHLRDERGNLVAWVCGLGGLALIVGVISHGVASAGISEQLNRRLARLGSGSVLTPSGYIGFSFAFFVLAVSIFMCAQLTSARAEEAQQRLATVLALPVARRDWLAGRLGVAIGAAAAISLCVGVLTWAGVVLAGGSVSLLHLLQAGVNCLTVAILFLGFAALAYALVPRATAPIAYGMVTLAFLWYLFGALLGAPEWLVALSPFRHVGLAPAHAFRPVGAAVMLTVGAVLGLLAIEAFQRRDLAEG
jgi:ABC-2 type transport system permease protein